MRLLAVLTISESFHDLIYNIYIWKYVPHCSTLASFKTVFLSDMTSDMHKHCAFLFCKTLNLDTEWSSHESSECATVNGPTVSQLLIPYQCSPTNMISFLGETLNN